ncbi:MAG: hypothetical protein Q9187_006277 [Circinaria calcarea]
MSSSGISFIDDLVARRTDEDYGKIRYVACSRLPLSIYANTYPLERFVSIPGFEALPEMQQTAVLAKLDQLQRLQDAPSVNANALHARLELISSVSIPDTSLSRSPPSTAPTTPPPDLEADKEEHRLLEEQARKDLEEDGCPPCYPADPAFLMEDPSAQYKEIILYWESLPMTAGAVLCAQLKDRKVFRRFQERNRRYYLQRKTFTEFENKVCERRRKHQFEGNVHLHPDPTQQAQLETWIEFQDYHLQIHEGLEKEVQIERENLETARTKLENADSSETEHAAFCYEVRLASARSKLKLHGEILLQWIEQQRIVMVTALSTSGDATGNCNDQVDPIRKAPASHRQKKKPKAHSVLNPVQSGISKHAPRKRSPRRQKPEIPREADNMPAYSGVSQINILRTTNLRESKSRGTKENAHFLPFGPQKVTKTAKKAFKAKQSVDINANLRAMSGLRTIRQRNLTEKTRPRQQRPAQQCLPNIYITKSGRKSRRPKQPGFVSYK